MKREEIQKLLESDGEMTVKERLDAIMQMNGADIERERGKASGLQSKLDEASAKLDEFEKARQAQLSGEERLEEAMKAVAAQQRDLSIKSNRIDAKSILKAVGLDDESVEAQLDIIVTEDSEDTAARAKALASLVTTQRDAAKAETEQAMLKKLGTPSGGSGEQQPTKDEFAKMTYAQKLDLKQNNPDLFASFNS